MAERFDRIALIVAAVLVVLLTAGGGTLAWLRYDTLLGETAPDPSAAVSLKPFETTSAPAPVPAAATATPAAQRKPSVPVQPRDSEIAYIVRARRSGDTVYLTYDPGSFMTGTDAEVSAKKHGLPAALGGYFIANDTHTYRSATLSRLAVIVVTRAGSSGTETLTPAAFRDAFAGGAKPDGSLQKAAYWIFRDGGSIVRVEQFIDMQ